MSDETSPAENTKDELADDQLNSVAGGINPQPLPPFHEEKPE